MNTKDELIDQLKTLIKDEGLSYYDCQAIADTAKKEWMKHRHKDKDPVTYADFDIGERAFDKVINSDFTPNQALSASALELGRTEEYVKEVKHRNYLHSNRIVKRFKSNDLIKAIESDEILDINELSTASRLYLFIKTAYMFKQYILEQQLLHERLQKLEKSQIEQEEINNTLMASISAIQEDIKALQQHVGINDLPPKERAKRLAKDFTPKQIANAVGVSTRTVRRWLKESNK